MGAQIITLGKANSHAMIQADIHKPKKLGIKPTAFKVVIPEMRQDIMPDKMNGKSSLESFMFEPLDRH
jgi:hypothetical protein